MENKNTRHIIIIVWRWRDFEKEAINATRIRDTYGGQVPDLVQGKGVFYNDYTVAYSENCTDALLVAANIYQDGEQTDALLDQLINRYSLPAEGMDKEIMLLLHRGHNYKEADVNRLLQAHKGRVQKIFLFANGHDYIYYGQRGQGLLNDAGGFAREIGIFQGIERGSQNLTIPQPYFDRVWFYYSNEFESKVYALKEEIFACLFPLLLSTDTHVLNSDVVQLLRPQEKPGHADNLLWYRLKSFCGQYGNITDKNSENFDAYNDERKEVEAILKAEGEIKQSLLFDDCIANLEQQQREGIKFVSEEYEELKGDLKTLFFEGEADKTIMLEDLRLVGQKFNYLVKIIPGVMD